MNERIKELARQAGFDVEDRTNEIWFDEGWYTSIVERFAELVEAAAVARERARCLELFLTIMGHERLVEREACLVILETYPTVLEMIKAIRARGEK